MSNTLESSPPTINWGSEFSYPKKSGTGEVSPETIKEAVDNYLSVDTTLAQDVANLKAHAILDSSYPTT